MLCYTYKTIHFWLKYNDLANVRKTPKLIEGSHRDLQDYRHYVITCTFFTFFYVFFQNPKSRDFLRFFCRVSYVFSNYGGHARDITEDCEVAISSMSGGRYGKSENSGSDVFSFICHHNCEKGTVIPPLLAEN